VNYFSHTAWWVLISDCHCDL